MFMLAPVAVAVQSPSRPQRVEHAVVIADVLNVGTPRGLSCKVTADSICVTGVPDGAYITVRKVLFGKLSRGHLGVFSAAPVQLKAGRRALLMERTGRDWVVMGASRPDKPCFDEAGISPEDDLYAIVRPVAAQYCIVAR